jgi:hypothetical protein
MSPTGASKAATTLIILASVIHGSACLRTALRLETAKELEFVSAIYFNEDCDCLGMKVFEYVACT